MEEYEGKFLNIDLGAIRAKLEAIGAQKVGEFSYRRKIFDYPGLPLDKDNAWVRLRDEGDHTTLTYKKHEPEKITEIEFTVSDFDTTAKFLFAIGLIEKGYIENRRERWQKDHLEFDIDFWPGIPPLLEIESTSWEAVAEGVQLLELNQNDQITYSVQDIYRKYGIELLDYPILTFDTKIETHE